MNRFRLFVIGNLCVISLVGWLQWTLFDYGGPAAAASHWVARAGGVRWHK